MSVISVPASIATTMHAGAVSAIIFKSLMGNKDNEELLAARAVVIDGEPTTVNLRYSANETRDGARNTVSTRVDLPNVEGELVRKPYVVTTTISHPDSERSEAVMVELVEMHARLLFGDSKAILKAVIGSNPITSA